MPVSVEVFPDLSRLTRFLGILRDVRYHVMRGRCNVICVLAVAAGVLLVVLRASHVWRERRVGGLVVAEADERDLVLTRPGFLGSQARALPSEAGLV